MKIRKIHIDGFGKLHNFDIEPGPGINVFYGSNEAGKSTLHLFIRSMLYGASTKRRLGAKSCYERMRPWQNPSVYRGRMEIEFEQHSYIVERDFNKDACDLSITELKDGRQEKVKEPELLMSRMLNGLSETAYVNTVSAGQLGAATQKDMAAELRRYSTNISSTMNPKLNADNALRLIAEEKARLEEALDTEAPKEYNKTLTEIERIEQELADPENENKINLFTEAAGKVRRDNDALSQKLGETWKELDSYKEMLRNRGFGNEEEINGIERVVNAAYADLMAIEEKAFSRSAVALIVLCIIAGAGLAAYAYMYAIGNIRIAAYIGAAAFLIIAAGLCIRLSGLKRSWKSVGDDLMNLMKPYIGLKRPDEESMDRFAEYINEARKIAGEINDIRGRQNVLGSEQKKLGQEYSTYLDRLTAQQQTRQNVEERLTRLNELKDRAVRLERRIKDNKLIREKLDAAALAEDTLTELSADIKNAAGTYINKEASGMIAAITGNAYDSISAGQNYDINLNSKDGMISVDDMSAGTADQVYLAIRLATVRFITGAEDPLPLILDDSFNLYDDGRLEASIRFLASEYRGQTLIFTCQNREENVLRKAGIQYRKLAM